MFTPIGTGTNPGTDFSTGFTTEPLEPLVEAIPFDPSGNPIVIPVSGGGNAAIGVVVALAPIPEPTGLSLVWPAALASARLLRRSHAG